MLQLEVGLFHLMLFGFACELHYCTLQGGVNKAFIQLQVTIFYLGHSTLSVYLLLT